MSILCKHLTFLSLTFLILQLCVACDKKCQTPAQTAFTTFTDQEWRLVDTNSPSLSRNLNRSTFIIMVFRRNYTGEIYNVENNDRFENPSKTFIYNVDPELKLLRVKYLNVTAEGQETPATGNTTSTDSISEYKYDLNREFELVDTSYNTFYRFVPFTGVVNPDSTCTF